MSEYPNGKQCVGVEITADTLEAYAGSGDLAELDKADVLYANTDADFEYGDEDDYTALAEQELEGQELANAECRMEYDLNSLEAGFCCQAFSLDMDGMDTPMGLIASSTKLEAAAEGVTFMDADVFIGAELFASASGMGVSLLTLAASVLVFSQ